MVLTLRSQFFHSLRHFSSQPRGQCDGMGQPLRIHPMCRLMPDTFLARVVSLLLRAVFTLCVNDQEAGHDVASLFGADLANRFFVKPAPGR
jgi:hypothetical protein